MNPTRLTLSASIRHYRQHPLQLALTLLGIALGAAVIVAVALATAAASTSFDRSLSALAGPMTHELRARQGALSEELYRQLRLEQGLRRSMPIVTQRVRIGEVSVELMGIDPLAMTGGVTGPPSVTNTIPELMTLPGAIIAAEDVAQRLSLEEDVATDIIINGRRDTIVPVDIFASDSGDWFSDALVADIASVQSLAGRRGEIDAVQLALDAEAEAALRAWLPSDVELRAFDDQRQTFDDMTRAFRTNLTAMSLLTVLVGGFLVYNAMAFGVVQRTPSFAILRMLGVTPGQLFQLLLVEAVVLGFIGGVLGAALGIALGQGLLLLVAQTVSDLYVNIEATRPDIGIGPLLAALATTMTAVVVATLAPARAAAITEPATLERPSSAQDRTHTGPWSVAGLALMVACPLLLGASGSSLMAGFAALFLLISGYSLLCPGLLKQLLIAFERLIANVGSTPVQIAFRGMRSALPRTATAIVALTIAVSAAIGVSIMIGSFRTSVDSWLASTLQGDLYIYIDAPGERLDPTWPTLLRTLPGVKDVVASRVHNLRIDDEKLRTLVIDASTSRARGFQIVAGPADAALRMLNEGTGLLVSEPLANRHQLTNGDSVQLSTPKGPVSLSIVGVYRDFASSFGAAVLPLAVYQEYWEDREISNLSVVLSPRANPQTVRETILKLGGDAGLALTVVSNRQIRERSLEIFDRTFVITDVLRALVILVAFVGIVSALTALFLERRREFALLRATGVTPGQLHWLVVLQAGGMGTLAGILALPLGGALSILLIDVINRRSFGWTLTTQMDNSVACQALLLSVTAAMLAALWPARRLAAGDLREALYAP